MELVNISTGAIATVADLVAANPMVSFPSVLTAAIIEPFGFSVVQPTAMPTPANSFYTINEGAPSLVDSVWTQTWVTAPMPLASAQSAQLTNISNACANAIVSGFTSSALGTGYTYPSKVTDQQNLAASVLASILPGVATGWTTPFWCATQPTDASAPVWAWVDHTAAQIQQVGNDAKTAILAYQTQNATLAAQVMACTDVDDVAKIVWVNPTTT